MNLFNLMALSPATGDPSPTRNIIVIAVLAVAVVTALVLGLWKGRK